MFWDRPIGNTDAAYCFGYGSLDPDVFVGIFESQSALNLLLDMMVFGLALPMYRSSDGRRRTRFALLVVFFLGGV